MGGSRLGAVEIERAPQVLSMSLSRRMSREALGGLVQQDSPPQASSVETELDGKSAFAAVSAIARMRRRPPVMSMPGEDSAMQAAVANRAARNTKDSLIAESLVSDEPEDEQLLKTIVPAAPNALSFLRDSTLHAAAYLRYQVAAENQVLGEEARHERDERLMRKEIEAQQWQQQGRERAFERLQRQKRSRKQKRDMMQRRSEEVRDAKDQREKARQLMVESQALSCEKARQRVIEASSLASKLAAAESASAASAAAEGKRTKEVFAKAAAGMRRQLLMRKQAMASQIKQLHARTTAETAPQLVAAAARGREKREAARQWGVERGRREITYIERARSNRERALRIRQAAKAAMEEAIESRKKAAAKERANDKLVTDERERIRESNKREAAHIYRQRFATQEAAAEYEGSGWKSLLAAPIGIARDQHEPADLLGVGDSASLVPELSA